VVNSKTGRLVAVKSLSGLSDQEIIIISSQGQTIRLGLKNIPELGRATQGVRIMRLNEGDHVVSLALVDKDMEEDEPEPAPPKVTSSKAADTSVKAVDSKSQNKLL